MQTLLFFLARRALLLCAFAGMTLATGCASSPDMDPAGPIAMDPSRALSAVNAFRAEHGLGALQIDPRLMLAADAHSKAMASRNRLDHNLGGPVTRRVQSFGYDWGAAAENIGRGYADFPAAMRGWIDSPGHRKNLLNPRVTHVGFAGARGGGRNYWTQIFASERTFRTSQPAPASGGLWPLR